MRVLSLHVNYFLKYFCGIAMEAKSGSSFRLSATLVTLFAHLLVIIVTTLVLVSLQHFRQGLAFESRIKEKIFNVIFDIYTS